MKHTHIIFLAISTISMTGCQSLLDMNQRLEHNARVNYNKQAANKSSTVKKCWENLHKVQQKIQSNPSRAGNYLSSMNKMLYNYDYGSGCMHVPGYAQALQQSYQHTQQIAANYPLKYSLR